MIRRYWGPTGLVLLLLLCPPKLFSQLMPSKEKGE